MPAVWSWHNCKSLGNLGCPTKPTPRETSAGNFKNPPRKNHKQSIQKSYISIFPPPQKKSYPFLKKRSHLISETRNRKKTESVKNPPGLAPLLWWLSRRCSQRRWGLESDAWLVIGMSRWKCLGKT